MHRRRSWGSWIGRQASFSGAARRNGGDCNLVSEATSKGRLNMDQRIPHSEAWGLVVIMALVASWLLYRYFAPKTWRE